MRDGYVRERNGPPNTEDLVAPDGKSIVRANYNSMQEFAIVQSNEEGIKSRKVNSSAELDDALDVMAEEHYQLTTTRQNRFHNWRKKFLADPIWGWLAFLLAVVVAVVGWMN